MKTRFLLLFLLSFIASIRSQELNFNHIAATEGLSHISVMSIWQDEIGYMWFGTRSGLNRFDGNSIEVYRMDEQGKSGLPSNLINKVLGDNKGMIYLIAGYNNLVAYDMRKNNFKTLESDCQAMGISKNGLWYERKGAIYKLSSDLKKTLFYQASESWVINCFYETIDNDLLVGTENGLYQIDNKKNIRLLVDGANISAIYEDRKKNIWLGSNGNGMFRLLPNGRLAEQGELNEKLSSKIIRDICEDNNGEIWIGTFAGLNKLAPETGKITVYSGVDSKPTQLSHSSIYSLFKDNQGTVWVGTYFGGVNYFNPEMNKFSYFPPEKGNNQTVNYPIVGKMTEDTDHNLWICTEGGGLNILNRKTGLFTYYLAGKPNSVSHNNLKCIWFDRIYKKIYIGTHTGGIDIYDLQTNTFRNINKRTHPELTSNVIVAFQSIGDDLLVATQHGTVLYNKTTDKIRPFRTENSKCDGKSDKMTAVFLDINQNLWFDHGLELVRYNIRTKDAEVYSHSFGRKGSVGRQAISCIYQDKRRQLFFGTNGSGLFRYLPNSNTFERFSVDANQILSNNIIDITEISNGKLVLLTNLGVDVFDPISYKSRILDRTHGFPIFLSINGNGVFAASNGDVFVSGINGLAAFSENQIETVRKDYHLFFSELYINNQRINPDNDDKIEMMTLPFQKKIKLRYKQNNINIKYATSNYIKTNIHKYQYRLEGLSNNWQIAHDEYIRYNNLSPGKYRLVVREIVDNGNKAKEISLLLQISPPFYASLPAIVFYILFLGFVAWRFIHFYVNRIQLRASLKFEKQENERIIDLNETKLRFFTNISHEFRTPLTLIIGQIEALTQMGNLSPTVRNKLSRVYKNARLMRDMIGELLDFSKQEHELLTLKVSKRNIVDFLYQIFLSFSDMATTKKIHYQFECEPKEIMLYFDPIQLQKVFINIISNAFKYTPDGSITLKLINGEKEVRIELSDTGIGIQPGDETRIFERFYQSSSQNQKVDRAFGTGVGLALTKGIIESHHAKIEAINNEKKGCTFSVTLKHGSEHFTEEEILTDGELEVNNMVRSEILSIDDLLEPMAELEMDGKIIPSILIVEDNIEMREFLKEIFHSIYLVSTASDGVEALEILKTMNPDIILSDVMMPNMTGKELCAKLKTNFETSHIPVVLITADASEAHNLEGLMLGADDYIIKPFNVKILISRCNNLVMGRKKLQEKYIHATNINSSDVTSIATNKSDQQLLDKAHRIVMQNLNNPEFDVKLFASEMALGKSKLYLKIKGITGMTPNDFILNIKLKKAAVILEEERDKNISEIAYYLGFSAPRYFSQNFKELFGVSPIEYRKNLTRQHEKQAGLDNEE